MDELKSYAQENDLIIRQLDIESIDEKNLSSIGSEFYDDLEKIDKHIEDGGSKISEWWLCFQPKTNTWAALVGLRINLQRETISIEVFTIHKLYQDSGVSELMENMVYTRAKMMNYNIVASPSSVSLQLDDKSFIGSRFSKSRIKHPGLSSVNTPFMNMRFSIKYENRLASKLVEREPRLLMYLSSNFCGNSEIYELGDDDNVYEAKGLHFKSNLYLNYVPRDLKLNMQVFTNILNETDDWCGNQAGSCKINFSDILRDIRSRKKYSRTHDLAVTVANDFLKGKITLTITADDLKFSDNVTLTDRRKLYKDIDVDGERVKQQIMQFIGTKYNKFQKIDPTWKAIQRIHAYVYATPSAPMLPASVFDIPLSKPAQESFYIGLLKIVLRRYDQSMHWFMNEATDTEIGRVIIEMSTVYVNWCKYIPDQIYTSRRGNRYTDRDKQAAKKEVHFMESFDSVGIRGRRGGEKNDFQQDPPDASDCEDFAKAILEFFHEIQVGSWKSEEMKKIVQNCDLWYKFAVLGGVSNAKLDGHFEKLTKMNAHEFVILIPKALFWIWYMNGSPKSPLHLLVSDEEKRKGKGLRIEVGEGTGLLYPCPNSDPSADIRRQLEYQNPTLMKQLRKRYTYESGKESSFYKTCTTLFTSDFAINSIPYLDFYFCEKARGGRKTYGVKFSDISGMQRNVCIKAHKPMMKDMRLLVKRVLKDVYHPAPHKTPIREQINKFCNTEFVQTLKDFSVHEVKGSKQRYITDPNAVTCFVKSNKATAEMAEEIISMLKKNNMRCIVKPELVTKSGVGGYFIILIKRS